MAERTVNPCAPGAAERTADHVRAALARGDQRAQVQLLDGTPLSDWVKTPEALDQAVKDATRSHPRDALRTYQQGPVD